MNSNQGGKDARELVKRRAGMLARSRTQIGEKTSSQKRKKLEKNQTKFRKEKQTGEKLV